jgi:hypothetical protein
LIEGIVYISVNLSLRHVSHAQRSLCASAAHSVTVLLGKDRANPFLEQRQSGRSAGAVFNEQTVSTLVCDAYSMYAVYCSFRALSVNSTAWPWYRSGMQAAIKHVYHTQTAMHKACLLCTQLQFEFLPGRSFEFYFHSYCISWSIAFREFGKSELNLLLRPLQLTANEVENESIKLSSANAESAGHLSTKL